MRLVLPLQNMQHGNLCTMEGEDTVCEQSRPMLKQPGLKSSGLHSLVFKDRPDRGLNRGGFGNRKKGAGVINVLISKTPSTS